MVLFEIDADCVLSFPFEGNAPWAVDMDRVAHGSPTQPVEIEAGNVHLFRPYRLIQARQAQTHPVRQVRTKLRRVAVAPECDERAAPEGPNHVVVVKDNLTSCQL